LTDEVEQIKKSPRPRGKSSFLKRAFVKGVAGILPALLTIIVLVWCYQFLRNYVAVYVNTVAEWVVRGVGLEQEVLKINKAIADNISAHIAPADPDAFELQLRPVTGIILSLVLIYVVGSFISTFVGKKLFPQFERMFLRLPIVKAVYPYARQVTDFFLGEQAIRFESIVAVEYPRKGIYSVGFVTNEGIRAVCDKVNRRLLVVFIPSSPTPITGYTIMVRPEDTIPLDMSIDDVLRMSISGGVILPENQRLPRGKAKPLQVGTMPPLRDAESGEDDNPEAQ
jgi:uncharacterized membrane protein